MTPSRLAGLVAATLVAAAGLVGLNAGPAAAAVCSTSGISVVVDANDGAGGGINTGCDPVAGSKDATAVFRDAGVTLTRNRDGSVCQVNDKPANAPCQGLGTQYWGLFWSDGKSGTWVYSQQGVDSLNVPKNGSVAWAWQSSSTQRKPGVAAPVIKTTPKPTPKPTKTPTKKPKPTKTPKPTKAPTKAATVAATPSAQATVTTSAGTSKKASPKASATASATPSATASASPDMTITTPTPSEEASALAASPASSEAGSDVDTGLPTWIPLAVIVVLAGGSGGVLWWRKRTGSA